jgi:hypothetical protein
VANEKVNPVDPTSQLPGYEQIDRWLTDAGDEKVDRRDRVIMQLGRAKWAIRQFLHGSPEEIERLRSEFRATASVYQTTGAATVSEHLHDLVSDTLGRDNYAAVDRCVAAERSKRWAVVLGLQPVQDGNMWWLSWGGLPEGVNAFAETPEACIEAFDKAMAAVAKVPQSSSSGGSNG